jgi:hypothetical protein
MVLFVVYTAIANGGEYYMEVFSRRYAPTAFSPEELQQQVSFLTDASPPLQIRAGRAAPASRGKRSS